MSASSSGLSAIRASVIGGRKGYGRGAGLPTNTNFVVLWDREGGVPTMFTEAPHATTGGSLAATGGPVEGENFPIRSSNPDLERLIVDLGRFLGFPPQEISTPNDQEQPHKASCPNPMELVQVNPNVPSPTSKSVLHSTDLGRWADVDDGDDEDEENEEGEIPIENMDLNEVPESEDPIMIDISNVQGANRVLIPTIAESISVVNDVPSHGVESDLPLPVVTRASIANTSIITSSPGRAEVSFVGRTLYTPCPNWKNRRTRAGYY
ncbi:hypothetical protein NE237_018806 [Protea cynaroides]|uniref:Uncharacterized protein n=1 Tax=Protea cynaroides TaxID=273540 RepID=A0A9Q0QPB9_9MAGN|nr:hypothetical protein NE237_018806 [Protea cynaroides]